MCMGAEALAIAAAAAQAAGTGLKWIGQNRVNDERRAVMRAENERQRRYQDESMRQIAETTKKVGRSEQERQENEATAERIERMTPDTTTPGGGEYTQAIEQAPTVVKGAIGRQIADAIRRGRSNVKNLARLSAFGDSAFDTNVNLLRSAENIQRIANNAYGSSQVVPFELQAANMAGRNFDLAGDIASGLGNIGFLYATTMNPATGSAKPNVIETPERSGWDVFTGKPKIYAGRSQLPSFYLQ
jgi:hypothetical protein